MRPDTSFDRIAAEFEAQIYGSAKGRLRLDLLWTDLAAEIPQLGRGGLSVLDAGGGAGHMALRLAQAGNRVVLCDPSQAMLARADANLHQAGVRDPVSLIRATINELHTRVNTPFEVVLCHAVLEYLPDPETVLADLATFVNP